MFFVQAEDGIRDIGVTGVQTCALPILTTTSGVGETAASQRGRTSPKRRTPPARGRRSTVLAGGSSTPAEIGRAWCRERVEISGGPVSLKKKQSHSYDSSRNRHCTYIGA